MTSLYDHLLPRFQAINTEGGNWMTHLFSRPILDAVDAGADQDTDLGRIRAKIRDAIDAHQHKRDHDRFSAIFNVYSEAVVFLAMRARGLDIQVLPERRDKTPDFLTRTAPIVGFELKTLDVHRPSETYEAAMNQGFEAGYEALKASRAAAKTHLRGSGIGTAISSFAPHGEGAGPKEAVIQAIRKVRGNVKAGQYEDQPTILVVSLVRLGVDQDGVQLRRWQEEDEDFGGCANGYLYTIAAHTHGESFSGHEHKCRPGPYDLGALNEAGILLDHLFIAGIVFVETTWSETQSPKVLTEGIRFNGVWNTAWEDDPRFSPEQKAETKRCFQRLCHAWNDVGDSRSDVIPNLRRLRADLFHLMTQFMRKWAGRTPNATALQVFMVEADRLYVIWKAAELSLDPDQHTPLDPVTVFTGHADGTGFPVIGYAGPSTHPGIPQLEFCRQCGTWLPSEDVGLVTSGTINI